MAEDEPKKAHVVYVGYKGEAEDSHSEVSVPGLPVFKRDVPQELPEPTAQELVKAAEAKAGETKEKGPPAFRLAKAAEVKAIKAKAAKAEKAAEAAAVAVAEETPAREES